MNRVRYACAFLALALLPVLAQAGDEKKTDEANERWAVEVRVDGLSCPFCAYSLEKQLDKLPQLDVREIRVKDGVVALSAPADEPVDFGAIPKAVEKAGFTPREIRVQGAGLVRRVGDEAALVSPEDEVLLRLSGDAPPGGWPEAGALAVRFSGVIREDGEAKGRRAGARLELTEVTPLPDER